MITQIGIVAGEILNYLDQNGIVNLEEVIENIDKPPQVILMSLGWLARENHILVTQKENTYLIELKKKKQKIK